MRYEARFRGWFPINLDRACRYTASTREKQNMQRCFWLLSSGPRWKARRDSSNPVSHLNENAPAVQRIFPRALKSACRL